MTPSSKSKENPRTARVRKIILDAGIDLLLTGGASDVTANRISEATGVARTTIYRHWPDQPSLLLGTIEVLVNPHYETPDTGDLETDLRSTLTGLRARLAKTKIAPVFAALLDQSSRNNEFAPAQREFAFGLARHTTQVLERAQQRGELQADLKLASAAAMLVSPLLFQGLLAQSEITDDFIDSVLSQFLLTNTKPAV